jgi:predicted AlkP superfamily phosphohydrolase/phosphomutase
MQTHCIDFANHTYMNRRNPSEEDSNQESLEEIYRSVDRMVGALLEGIDGALVVLVSDHGATESPYQEVIEKDILEKAGLLSFIEEDGNRRIDWTRTRAVPQRACYVYVNLKGRDPQGIVPQEEYEAIREKIIKTLYDYEDPQTKRRVFSLVLRKEDARILGLYEDDERSIGDIVYALYPEFALEHGRQLATSDVGRDTVRSLLTFTGHGIKRNHTVKRNVWLVDVVPTLCHALSLPMPRDAEGAVIYGIFEDPDFLLKKIEKLEKECARWRKAQDGYRRVTHEH